MLRRCVLCFVLAGGAIVVGCGQRAPLQSGSGMAGRSPGDIASSGTAGMSPVGTVMAGAPGGSGGATTMESASGGAGAMGSIDASGGTPEAGPADASDAGIEDVGTSSTQDAGIAPAVDASGAVHGWVNRTPAVLPVNWPVGRRQPAVVYDRSTKRLIVYGGYSNASPIQDTWAWDGQQGLWERLSVQPPSTFDMFGAAWNDASESVMLFGGETFPGAAPSNALWSFASAWNAVEPLPTQLWPSAQLNPLLAYDATRARLVLLGSGTSPPTWEWDVAQRAWSEPLVGVSPTNNSGVFAWDERRHVGVFFGDGPPGVTWEWDGVAGTWTPKQSGNASPAPRTLSAAAYDSDAGRVMLFGGRPDPVGIDSWTNDLWEWDGTTWTLLDSGDAVAPPDLQAHGLAYDSDRHCLVTFGGDSPFAEPRDLWEWHR